MKNNLDLETENLIKKNFAEMQSMDDLLDILNVAKKELMQQKAIPFTIRQLNYHSLSKYKAAQYKISFIPKKTGGQRTIHAPVNGLKQLQAAMNKILQTLFEPRKAAYGFVPGKSIADNAAKHINKGFVYNLDLKDFFPSIDRKRVWVCLLLPPFNLGTTPERKQIANRISILCTTPIQFVTGEDKQTKEVLPQGAPTSPTITNVIAQNLDRLLEGVAKRFRLTYTRYADDITFSGNRDIFGKNSEFIKEIRCIIEGQHFTVNEAKVRLQQKGYRQEVTGLIVNEKVNVTRRYTRQLRSWLYLWETYGYDKAYQFFLNDYTEDKGHINKEKPSMEFVIGGKLNYLKMIKGKEDSVYQKLADRFKKLTIKVIMTNKALKESHSKDIDVVLEKLVNEGLESAMDYYLNE